MPIVLWLMTEVAWHQLAESFYLLISISFVVYSLWCTSTHMSSHFVLTSWCLPYVHTVDPFQTFFSQGPDQLAICHCPWDHIYSNLRPLVFFTTGWPEGQYEAVHLENFPLSLIIKSTPEESYSEHATHLWHIHKESFNFYFLHHCSDKISYIPKMWVTWESSTTEQHKWYADLGYLLMQLVHDL